MLTVVLEQCLAPVPGGTGRYSREIAAALASTAPPGWAVRGTVAWRRDVSAARVPGVGGPVRLALPHRPLVAAWDSGLPPKVPGAAVLAPTPLAPPRRAGQRLVVTVHDAVPWTHPETLTRRGVAWHRRTVGRAVSGADAVLVPTRAVAVELATALHVDVARFTVVPEGVSDVVRQLPADAEERAERLGARAPYLLTLATLEPRKGLDVLVRALARPEAPQVPLLVAGQGGWGGVDPVALARAAGLSEGSVRTLGRVDDADLAVLLHRASALVVPSRAEGFGLPLLEAMAAGTPVLTSDVPALVEVAGGAARVVPRDDEAALAVALAELLADPGAAAALVAAGSRRAADFSWSTAAWCVWGVLLGSAAGPDGGRPPRASGTGPTAPRR